MTTAAAEFSAPTLAVRDLMHASRELTGRVARRLQVSATDVTAVGLLEMLGPMTVSALADRLGIRTPSATVLVDRLAGAGRVERRPHPSDGRRTLVHLTEPAQRENWQLWEPAIRAVDDAAAQLTDAERAVVAGYLARVAQAMDAYP